VGQNKPPKWTTSECQNHLLPSKVVKALKVCDEGENTYCFFALVLGR
jgi:hypothetical protein